MALNNQQTKSYGSKHNKTITLNRSQILESIDIDSENEIANLKFMDKKYTMRLRNETIFTAYVHEAMYSASFCLALQSNYSLPNHIYKKYIGLSLSNRQIPLNKCVI